MVMTTRKRHSPEQVVRKLVTADRMLGEGKDVADVCRELGVSEPTYYRWRTRFGGLEANDAKRLRRLGREERPLGGLLADAELEKVALREIAKEGFEARNAGEGRHHLIGAMGVSGADRLPGDQAEPGRQRHQAGRGDTCRPRCRPAVPSPLCGRTSAPRIPPRLSRCTAEGWTVDAKEAAALARRGPRVRNADGAKHLHLTHSRDATAVRQTWWGGGLPVRRHQLTRRPIKIASIIDEHTMGLPRRAGRPL